MSKGEFDLDKELNNLHEKYQQDSIEMPPEILDTKISQAAHDALKKSNIQSINLKNNKRAWYVPFSVAAVLVLSLSVVMKLAFESPPASLESGVLDSSREEVELNADKYIEMEMRQQYKKEQLKSSLARKQQQKMLVEKHRAKKQPQLGEVKRTRVASAPAVMSSATSASIMPKENNKQKNEIKSLLKLLDMKAFDKLKQALVKYQKTYPLIENDTLPQSLRILEIKWKSHSSLESPVSD